jgi:hypothetical protein
LEKVGVELENGGRARVWMKRRAAKKAPIRLRLGAEDSVPVICQILSWKIMIESLCQIGG